MKAEKTRKAIQIMIMATDIPIPDFEAKKVDEELVELEKLSEKAIIHETQKNLILRTGEECGMDLLNQVQFCPHCGKMICPEIITKFFPCKYCHNCGGKVEYVD